MKILPEFGKASKKLSVKIFLSEITFFKGNLEKNYFGRVFRVKCEDEFIPYSIIIM